ncbi:alanine/glycine:cation symporter family protein [Akkermansia sp.]|uniref:alanine/glycine:cation symporter family protein n=1 Tax=Akkermansia sp. TaxID=1872421 RepID=UPI003AADCA67
MLDALQNAFFQTGDMLTSRLSAFSSFLWGWPLLILLLGTHLYLTVILRFPQRYLLKALKLYFVKDHTDKGDISPFSSLMVALAANIGAGNIIGVGVAIAAGGPGAIFWCWLTGVLGMATRYSEGLLAIKYRVENKDGNMSGGPMFVLERGMKCKWLGVLFAVFTAIAAFGIGNLTQGNAAAEQLYHAFSIPAWGTATVLTALTALVMLGGIRGIARVCAFFVPVMAVLYILGCMYILIVQADYILPAIRYILDCAFTGEAAVMTAMRTGVARGLFSNEAGLGSAAIASAAAQNRNPVRQALISSSGPFWDTVVICALTGIVLTTSIIAHPDISCSDGSRLTTLAFSKIPYMGSPLLTLSLVTFVVSTILGWSYFGEKALEYLGGLKLVTPYRVIWVAAVFTGCISKIDLVWVFADCANGLMALPNLISLIALSGVLVQQTRYYLWQHRLDEYDESHVPEGK